MGKKNKREAAQHRQKLKAKEAMRRRQHSQPPKPLYSEISQQTKRLSSQVQQTRPRVPFDSEDSVLLIGEGDFSFSLSLVTKCRPAQVVATSFDSKGLVLEKYPAAEQTIQQLDHAALSQLEMASITKQQSHATSPSAEENWAGFSPVSSSDTDTEDDSEREEEVRVATACKVLFGIDATKLSAQHKKVLRPHLPFTKICFNFPHVGGISTDVNRQVRANQQLLVGFFNSVKTLLSAAKTAATLSALKNGDSLPDGSASVPGGSQVLVTLFEGEPYSLWNIRDLARHCGLQVIESFRFPWSQYPGYQHARTIGDIKTGIDRSTEGKRTGAWRGEEREARTFVLVLKEDAAKVGTGKDGRKRRRSQADSTDDDNDSD